MLNNLSNALLQLPRQQKKVLVLVVDGLICAWSAWAAVYLRIGEWQWLSSNQWIAIAAAVVLGVPILERAGIYRTIFRYTGAPAMLALARACIVIGCLYSLIFTFIGVYGVPRTIGLIQPVLLFVMLAASRVAAQYILGGNFRRVVREDATPRVLIYGAGEAGRQLAAALRRSSEMRPVGFLDDDQSLHSGMLEGLRVYEASDLEGVIASLGVTDVLLAIPSIPRRRRLEIVDSLRKTSVNIRTLPGLLDLARGQFQVSDIRPLQIEDLLGRDPVQPDPALLGRTVAGKTVLVTGAGGSIGGELSRQILALGPAKLVLVDMGEFALYAIHRELEGRLRAAGNRDVRLETALGSVRDGGRMRAILEQVKPDTIYHAAAYKHVPMVEQNALEGIRNNVFGTLEMAQLAGTCGVTDFVLISTDKAVRPTNIMGASKRLSELVVQALANETGGTRYSIVRFGNVLGSSGSVVPLFREQIGAGGPVTITHPEVTRYFMTIPEAAQLVLQAAAMAHGGEVFVLDMGEPVLIRDLAVNMIRLSGLSVKDEENPDGDIEIAVVGLRPGEKLHEELLIGEDPMPTDHERICRAHEHFLPLGELRPALESLQAAFARHDNEAALQLLRTLVPEYQSNNGQSAPPEGAAVAATAGRTRAAPEPALAGAAAGIGAIPVDKGRNSDLDPS